MPVAFAPTLPAAPTAVPFTSPTIAPGVNNIVPFTKGGVVPRVNNIVPFTRPPVPALTPLTTAPALPATGGALRAGGVGLAVVGAGILGLGIGNAVYEDLLGRPFGPSLKDLYFPQAQPQPLPLIEPNGLFPFRGGQCETLYSVGGQGSYLSSRFNRRDTEEFVSTSLRGPISSPKITETNNVVRWFVNGFDRFSGQAVTIQLAAVTAGFSIVSDGAFENITIDRDDRQPDNCGDPSTGTPRTPQSQPQPTLERPQKIRPIRPLIPLTPGLPSPRFAPVPAFLPELQGSSLPGVAIAPEPVPNFIKRPSFKPAPVPSSLPKPEKEPTKTKPKTPPLLCCPSVELKLDKLLEINEGDECDLTEVEQLLRDVLDKLSGNGAGEINTTPCNGEEPESATFAGSGLDGIYSAVDAITSSLSLIHENTRCNEGDCVVAIPDWWQVRKGADRPQLSVILRKGGTGTYHTLNIPHPIVEPRPTTSPIREYTAGQWQATIYLKDNSKFVVNANLKGEAIRVATEAATLIRPDMLPSPLEISTTERRGFIVNKSLMQPRYMAYYPTGQRDIMAQWRVNFS